MRDLLPADRAVNLTIWAVLLLVLAAWEARSLVSRRTAGIRDVVRLARRRMATRWTVLATWAWLGWHLFVRTRY